MTSAVCLHFVFYQVRAQFDYDPNDDDLIPCAQAGIAFKTGNYFDQFFSDGRSLHFSYSTLQQCFYKVYLLNKK